MTENERLLSRRSFVKAAMATGALGAGVLGGTLRAQAGMSTAKVYRFKEEEGKKFELEPDPTADVSALANDKWKFIIPVPPAVGAADDAPRDLVAFSNSKIAYFRNKDGTGVFELNSGWSLPADKDKPNVSKLDLGRNACAGRFSDGSLLDLFAQSDFPGGKAPRQFSIWQITSTGLVRIPVKFVTDFPWRSPDADLQHIVPGKFFKDSPLDDLIFYQGNRDLLGDTGTMQLLKLGFAVTPRLTSVRSTWSTILPCPSYDSKTTLTRVLLFDDGRVLAHHRGRRFVEYPSSGPQPMSPWVEIRQPTRRAHLLPVNRDPQPGPGEGPPMKVNDAGKELVNRAVVASPAPRIAGNKMKLIDPMAEDFDPENIDWWTLKGHTDECRLLYLPQVASGVHFLQTMYRAAGDDAYRYRVLDRNLEVASGDFSLPEPLPQEKLLIPGRFVKTNKSFDLLFYEA